MALLFRDAGQQEYTAVRFKVSVRQAGVNGLQPA